MLEGDFASAILAAPGVAGLIGDRVYPVIADQSGSFPAVVYQVVAKLRNQTHQGSIRLAEALIQVRACALTYREARLIAEGIRGAFHGFREVHGGYGRTALHGGRGTGRLRLRIRTRVF